MLALSEKCLHPTTNKPYVTSYGGGRDTSPEGLQVVEPTTRFSVEAEQGVLTCDVTYRAASHMAL